MPKKSKKTPPVCLTDLVKKITIGRMLPSQQRGYMKLGMAWVAER